jgi:hypothetical protein
MGFVTIMRRNPMPQNKPMTPEAVIQSIDDNYAPLSIDAKISIDDLLAQLIRSTLEAAAERAEAWYLSDDTDCFLTGMKKAILSPLTNPDEIECATLDEVNHRRGSDA